MKRLTVLALFVLITIQLLVLFNSQYTVWPEMIIYPWLMNHGFLLYKDIINPYFPLLSLILSGYFSVFDTSVINLRIFTYIIIVLTDLAIFWSIWRISGSLKKSLLGVLIYSLLQYSQGGNGLWFELVLAPLLILSLTLAAVRRRHLDLYLSGFLLALAVLIKQNAALFYLPIIFLFISQHKYKQLIHLFIPALVLGLLTTAYLLQNSLWQDFTKWAILLPLGYSNQLGFVLLPTLKQYLFIILPLISVFGVLKSRFKLNERIFWTAALILSVSFAFPRYENFHLQILVALSALFIVYMPKRVLIPFLLIVVLIFGKSVVQTWHIQERFLDQGTIELSKKVSTLDSVYLLNSPDLVYFLANKLPPKPWATGFPWYFEQSGFQENFINGLKGQETEYIVIGDPIGGGRYDIGNYLPAEVLQFISQNYYKKEQFSNYSIWQSN